MARKTAAWYAIAFSGKRGYTILKTKDPRSEGAEHAFGPYKTRKQACGTALYQAYEREPISGCKGVTIRGAGEKVTFRR